MPIGEKRVDAGEMAATVSLYFFMKIKVLQVGVSICWLCGERENWCWRIGAIGWRGELS